MMLLAFVALIMSAIATWSPSNKLPPPESPIPGYGIVELSWEVIPAPGQSPIVLNGTIEQVHSQLLEINPSYQAEVFEKGCFTPIREDLLPAPTAATAATAAGASTAAAPLIWRIKCGGYHSANIRRIKDGINYLNNITGQPRNGPGPNNCGRNAAPQALPGFYSIATGATKIVNACPEKNNRTVSGTGDHPDNWRVVVKGDKC